MGFCHLCSLSEEMASSDSYWVKINKCHSFKTPKRAKTRHFTLRAFSESWEEKTYIWRALWYEVFFFCKITEKSTKLHQTYKPLLSPKSTTFLLCYVITVQYTHRRIIFNQLLICNFAGCDETDAILRNRRSFYISTGRHVPKRELQREPVKEMTHFAVSQVFVQSPV